MHSFSDGSRVRLILGLAVLATAVFASLAAIVSTAAAAPSAEQKTKLKAAEAAIKKAGILYKSKKYDEAGESVKEATTLLTELSTGDGLKEVAGVVSGLRDRLVKAHQLLELEGVKLPELPAAPASAKGAGTAKGTAPGKGTPAAAGAVSFTKQVAPLLVGKCGGCHVTMAKGGFQMTSFTSLMKGAKDGIVVMPGNSVGSRIVEVIESGDMPRGGGKVTPQELATISKWIREGAKFDGANPGAPLSAGAAATPAEPERMKIDVAQASGKEEVQFARDIGPVLLANCIGCHGARNPRGQLGMTTFTALLRGGITGVALMPGKPDASLIVKKLRGTAADGDRMPLGKPPLDEATIAKFEKWIALGAKYDAPDPGQSLVEVVALVRAQNSSHDELSAQRRELAAKNWRLTMPDIAPSQHESDSFLVLGNVGEATLTEVARVAEEQLPKLEKLLKTSAKDPLVKGRMTIFVFDKRYDYGEIGTMVESRDIPIEWKGHWRYTVVDAYACVLPAKNNEYGLPALLAQQLAGVYVASQGQGKMPRWFAEGSARAIASKVDPKDARVRSWDQQIASVLGGSGKADAFITGSLPPEENDILSYSFVKFLMSSQPKYLGLVNSVKAGMPFDQAFAKSFGGTPSQIAANWAPKAASGKRGK